MLVRAFYPWFYFGYPQGEAHQQTADSYFQIPVFCFGRRAKRKREDTVKLYYIATLRKFDKL